MDTLKKFIREVQQLSEVLEKYKIAKIEGHNNPHFGGLDDFVYAEIMLKPYNEELLEKIFFYASAKAREHGGDSSIKLVYNSPLKKYVLTIIPQTNYQKNYDPQKEPMLEETENFMSHIIKSIKDFEVKTGHR